MASAVGIQGRNLKKQCSHNASLLLTHALGQGGEKVLDSTSKAGLLLVRYPTGAKPQTRSPLKHSRRWGESMSLG